MDMLKVIWPSGAAIARMPCQSPGSFPQSIGFWVIFEFLNYFSTCLGLKLVGSFQFDPLLHQIRLKLALVANQNAQMELIQIFILI